MRINNPKLSDTKIYYFQQLNLNFFKFFKFFFIKIKFVTILLSFNE